MNNDIIQTQLGRLQRNGMTAGIVGLVVWAIGGVLALLMPGGFVSLATFFSSYLIAYLFWFGVTAGSLALLMLHHVVGGGWGFIIRRFLEASTRLFPAMAIAFLPILLSLFLPAVGNNLPSPLYWWNRDVSKTDPILMEQSPYLNLLFFIARFFIYFAIFGWLAGVVNRVSLKQDRENEPKLYDYLTNFSARGLLIFTLVMTFAVVDWVMSLTPHWYSSIIGLLFVVAQGLSTFALMLVLVSTVGRDSEELKAVPSGYFRDLGNLTLAFVLLWAYASFSQFLIVYSGNTAEEAEWYHQRMTHGWNYVGTILIFAHFFVPLLVLIIASGIKRNPHRLAKVALFIIVMRFIDLLWWIAPTFHVSPMDTLPSIWVYIAAPVGMGGIWLSMWAKQLSAHLKDRPLMPTYDPRVDRNWIIDKDPQPANTPVVSHSTSTGISGNEVQHG